MIHTLTLIRYLFFYKWTVLKHPFDAISPLMGTPYPPTTPIPREPRSAEEMKIIHRTHISLSRCRYITFWKESVCLVNALAAKRYLREHGIPSTLVIGAQKEGNRLNAHAWLISGGKTVTGGRQAREFTPTAIYMD